MDTRDSVSAKRTADSCAGFSSYPASQATYTKGQGGGRQLRVSTSVGLVMPVHMVNL